LEEVRIAENNSLNRKKEINESLNLFWRIEKIEEIRKILRSTKQDKIIEIGKLDLFNENFKKEWDAIKEEKIREFDLKYVLIQKTDVNYLIDQRGKRTLKKLSIKERKRYN
jgi:hypothetical protein